MKWSGERDGIVPDTLRWRILDLQPWQAHLFGSWLAPLNGEQAQAHVLFRDTWFRGVPVPVMIAKRPMSVGLFDWYADITAPSHDEPTRLSWIQAEATWNHVWGAFPRATETRMQSIGYLPPCESAECTYTVYVNMEATWTIHSNLEENPDTLNRTASFPVEVTVRTVNAHDPESLQRVMTAVHDPEIDAILSGYKWLRFEPEENLFRNLLALGPIRSVDSHGVLEGIAYDCDLEVLDGDEIIWRTTCTEARFPWGEREHRDIHWQDEYNLLMNRIVDHTAKTITPGNLKLRIRSRPDLAMYALEYDMYWDGEIILPLADYIYTYDSGYTLVTDDDPTE